MFSGSIKWCNNISTRCYSTHRSIISAWRRLLKNRTFKLFVEFLANFMQIQIREKKICKYLQITIIYGDVCPTLVLAIRAVGFTRILLSITLWRYADIRSCCSFFSCCWFCVNSCRKISLVGCCLTANISNFDFLFWVWGSLWLWKTNLFCPKWNYASLPKQRTNVLLKEMPSDFLRRLARSI